MPAGRADDDLVDAGGPRGDDAHHDAARVRRAAARDVDRRAAHGHLAQPHALALRQRDVDVVAARPARATAPTLAIASSSAGADAGSSAVERAVAARRAVDAQRRRSTPSRRSA